MLSEELFTHHILDDPDGNEVITISDYLSQNFSVTIGETWTCLTCESIISPKIAKNISFILLSEQSFEYTKKVRRISHEKKTHLGKSCVTMNDLMSKFYESNELSDVICDECSKVSGTEQKSNFETKQSIVSASIQLRISLQRTEYNWETEIYIKMTL